jgi:hypothetical protein
VTIIYEHSKENKQSYMKIKPKTIEVPKIYLNIFANKLCIMNASKSNIKLRIFIYFTAHAFVFFLLFVFLIQINVGTVTLNLHIYTHKKRINERQQETKNQKKQAAKNGYLFDFFFPVKLSTCFGLISQIN